MDKSKFIKAGIIGMGGIGPAHYEALCRVGGVEVTSIAETDREVLELCAEKYGIPNAYTDYQAIIEDKDIEVVHVASPNHLHYEQAKAALEAGKHVVCEKPLAMNPAQSAELVSLAREKGLVNEVNFNHRFFPLVFQAREMIKRNELGAVTLVRASALGDFMLSLSVNCPDHWRIRPETVGMSKTMSVYGGHCLDLIQFVSGLRIEEVFADFGYVDSTKEGLTHGGPELEDYINVLLRFNDETKGAVTLSEAAPGRKCEVFFEIIGTEASVAWNLANPNEMWIGYQNQPNRLFYKDVDLLYPEARAIAGPPAWQQDGYVDSLRHCLIKVYDRIRDRDKKDPQNTEPDFATFETGHYMELILQAMIDSYRNGRWERIQCDI
jgi:predicted dehydrogenase